MGVRLMEEETWAAFRRAHTGILTTFRKDGRSVPVPTWFVVIDRTICLRSRSEAAKVRHIRQDPRVSFVIESGRQWHELTAVIMQAVAREIDDPAVVADFESAMGAKYGAYRTERAQMPRAISGYYAQPHVVFALDPVEDFISWDNAKIRLRSPE